MPTLYNRIAGGSIERLAALSDGLFAVAMTLLVLDLHAPAAETVHSERDLWRALVALAPRLLIYLMSFLTLGIFWVGQQTQLNHFVRARPEPRLDSSRRFCSPCPLMPFSTALMAEFIAYRVALLVYWANILLLGVLLFASWRYATRAALLDPDAPPDIGAGVERRIVIAQALYAFGALLCAVNTYWSITFIMLVQLNYVIAPRLGLLFRL